MGSIILVRETCHNGVRALRIWLSPTELSPLVFIAAQGWWLGSLVLSSSQSLQIISIRWSILYSTWNVDTHQFVPLMVKGGRPIEAIKVDERENVRLTSGLLFRDRRDWTKERI